MAGMLPGVESARRRRFHKSGGCLDAPLLAPHNSTRRSSFCLYASNHESRISSSSSLVCALFSPCLQLSPLNFPFSFYNCSWGCINLLSWFEFKQQRGLLYQAHLDESLGGAAREAKQRLDDKFRAQRVSETNRYIWAKFSNFFHGWLDVMMIPETQIWLEKYFFFLYCFWKLVLNYSVEERRRSLGELGTETYGSRKSGSRRFSWSKLSWKASEQEDCAVCLETFRNGETLIPLPCAHRFHSRCLKPWLENNSHCPCCRTTILSL